MASTSTGIYDRKTIVANIERDCLGEPGSSGLIMGAMKVGKTHLLDHFRVVAAANKETLYCRLSVDNLEASEVSDHSFLRLFLDELQAAVTSHLSGMELEEAGWRGSLVALQSVTGSSGLAQADAVKGNLAELGVLRELETLIRDLLSRPKLEPADTLPVSRILQRKSRRRIVLEIDEFHRIMRLPGLTNRLFAFLRGASTQGRIFTLVSSPVHLMDDSLHKDAAAEYDRRNLFNHYQTQFLEPFNQEEAEEFLDWMTLLTPPLTSDEKRYLCQLGGGSPYFLQKSRQLFVSNGRPSTELARRTFELRQAAPIFEPDFLLLWRRCASDERALLASRASGAAAQPSDASIADKLEREGYLLPGPGGAPFSTLFSEYVSRQQFPNQGSSAPPPAPAPGLITISDFSLVSDSVVTALGLARPSAAAIFTCRISNRSKREVTVRVQCRVVDYSQSTARKYKIKPGDSELKGFAIYQPQALLALQDAAPTNVDYSISLENPETVIESNQVEIRLLPPDNFLMAVFDDKSGKLRNYTWLIAAWVRRRGDELQKVLKDAGSERVLDGNQPPEGEDSAGHLRAQVKAIYNAVQRRKLQYLGNARVDLHSPEHYIQKVRRPEQSLTDGQANCLDMAVLFASLFSGCEIDPLIFLLPGHAVVGWKNGTGGLEFLQTTSVTENSFEEAREIGMKFYSEWQPGCDETLKHWPETIEDPLQFAILIDIAETCVRERITKI